MSGGLGNPAPGKYLRREMDPVAREFYRRLAEQGELATTRCERCRKTTFPPRERCPECGVRCAWIGLPRHGQLYAFTTQEAAVRFRAPDVLALAQLGDVVLPGIVRAPYAELRIGLSITVELMPEPDTGLTLLSFEPCRDASP